MTQGRRSEASRHRSPSRFTPPEPVARALGVAGPVFSLLPALVALVAVQALSPAAQRLPTDSARFDLAAAWAATEPGALVGSESWFTSPPLGRVQLGLLLRALQAGPASSVLGAAQGAVLLLAVAQAVLVWLLVRRLGASRIAAGVGTALFGIVPAAIAAHAEPSAAAVGAVWLLLACLLGLGTRRGTTSVVAGAAAAAALVSTPVALVPVVVLATALVVRGRIVDRRRTTARPGARLLLIAVGLVATVAAAAAAGVVLQGAPATPAAVVLDGLVGAQGTAPVLGAAALTRWATADPLALIVTALAVVLVARNGRTRALTVLAVVLALGSLWPFGADSVLPLVLLLPVAAVAVAVAVDLGITELEHPRFVRNVVGSSWLMGVAAVLVVAVVVWLTGLGGLVPGAAQPVARVERWLRTGVPAGQVVLVGLGAWPDLRRTSRADVGWYAGRQGASGVPSSTSWSSTDYVVTDASLERPRGAPAEAALDRSLRVARFGSGDAEMQVRAVRPSPAPTPTATPPTGGAERRAAALRVRTGGQLARNPRIEVDGEGRAALLAGDVDARVALVLAQFVTAHRVTVAGFGTAPGDTSGVRSTVLVSAVDGRRIPADGVRTGDLLRFLSELEGDYATRSIDATDDGVTASFAPDPAFEPTL